MATKDTNREKALTALLSTASIEQAAGQSGISRRTLHRFLEDETFKNEYRAAKSQIFEQSIGTLQIAVTQAVQTLQKNLACGIPSVEIRAAQIVLDNAFRGTELVELTTRLDALENAVKKQN